MRLLDKTVRILLMYGIVVLLISIPVFYFIIEHLYHRDVDDALRLKKKELVMRTKMLRTERDISLWLAMDREVSLREMATGQTVIDTIYPKLYLDTLDQELEPYRELRTTLVINHKWYTAIIRRSLVESEDLITGIAEAQAVLLILLFGGWIAINSRISHNIWSPFEQIIEWLEKYEMGNDPRHQIPSSGIREFDVLNNAVGNLTLKNHGIFIQQKTFIENASHEMQTPLAVLQSKLDLLVISEELNSDQFQYVQSMYETVDRLSHLNKSLLLLSQIENNQFDGLSEVSLSEILSKIITHLQDIARDKDITINGKYDSERLLRGNPMLIEICLSNLLTNAVTHTPAGGEILISLDQNKLVFSNPGRPLNFDESILFHRFGKGKASRYGVGLGLAIVKQISDLIHVQISYRYHDGAHEFILELPQS